MERALLGGVVDGWEGLEPLTLGASTLNNLNLIQSSRQAVSCNPSNDS